MAVDARHLNLIPSYDMNVYGAYGSNAASAAVLAPKATAEAVMPMYGTPVMDSFPVKAAAAIKAADSGLTYALPPPVAAVTGGGGVCRKRSRDDDVNLITPLLSFAASAGNFHSHQRHPSSVVSGGGFTPVTFLGEDVSFQIQQQQFEIDRIIAQHNEKVRMEIEEASKRNSRRIIAAMEESEAKRLRAREEEIDKINKINWGLEERVKTLCVENQMWRDLAQMNEATGNALRSNLEQVLAEQRHRQNGGDEAAIELADDAESCCGSNYLDDGVEERGTRTCAESRGNVNGDDGRDGNVNAAGKVNGEMKMCRCCGREESCVLLLPCRHLCLCAVCGSSLHVCPICKSPKNASLHVYF